VPSDRTSASGVEPSMDLHLDMNGSSWPRLFLGAQAGSDWILGPPR
jgi:hypothetical protein